ncbi:hypothetical protein V6000_005839 [Aspergillus fumigatus]
MSLSPRELFAISTTERICSAISLAGTSIIIISFLSSRSFRKPINRLVFYASWGNIMANVATMISQSGIAYGTSSCLCQFQAFLIQWSVARSDCPCLMPMTFILMVAVRMSQVHAR